MKLLKIYININLKILNNCIKSFDIFIKSGGYCKLKNNMLDYLIDKMRIIKFTMWFCFCFFIYLVDKTFQ